MIGLARSFGRDGYERVTGLLQMAGRNVNQKRVEHIWRAEGLKVPKRQPKRGRLWLADGSAIRLRPERANHVWAYDFVADRRGCALLPGPQAEMWLARSGRRRMAEPSASHRRPLFGCRFGTLSPSARQMCSDALLGLHVPAGHLPQAPSPPPSSSRPKLRARPITAAVKASSSSLGMCRRWRWLERCWPSARQARRSETASPSL